MNDYDVGARLRRLLLADLQRGRDWEPRRLQALVSDLCGEGQAGLAPALNYLLLTPLFQQALRQKLPLDPQLLLQGRQSLADVFAPTICSRMEPLLRGLLGLPDGAGAAPPPPPPPPAAVEELELELEPQLHEQVQPGASGSNRGVLVMLSFIAGVLVVGVLGGLIWLLQLTRERQQLAEQALSQQPPGAPAPAAPTPEPATLPPTPDLEVADRERAIGAVQQLYAALSSGNGTAAAPWLGPDAVDQFEPTFFAQFSRVSVADLVETDRRGSIVQLTGLVTFVYPDGTSQSESRSFSVDTASEPARIIASAFDRVMSPRQ
jgi:hypothetical protein